MDLSFDDARIAELLGRGQRLRRRRGHFAIRHRHMKTPEKILGLVFMDFH
jgi:hypothetical protein